MAAALADLAMAADAGPEGAVSAADLRAALRCDDPVAWLVRETIGGENGLLALAARRQGLAFAASLDGYGPELPGPLPPRLVAATTAVVVIGADGRRWLAVAFTPAALLARAGAPAEPMLMVTAPRSLRRHLEALAAPAALAEAVGRLCRAEPQLSAASVPGRRTCAILILAVAAVPVAALVLPQAGWTAFHIVSVTAFLPLGFVRLLAARALRPPVSRAQPSASGDLPAVTVMVALYREAAIVPGLLRALDRLDYPADRLEIRLILEADDTDTASAVARHARGRPQVSALVVPPGTPRTKPRALAYALAFCRADLVAVFDAEDRPDADQLRRAAAALLAGPPDLACVQARLEVDRIGNGLQRQFALEYAVLFGGILPWFDAAGLPLPLGGTSNHFKRLSLDQVLGWDPYNVTEDADLGFRLARYGFRSAMIDSATREEAPRRLGPWFRQRTRWIKGWAVTMLVHGRKPRLLAREAGGRAALAILAHGLANVAAPLCHPFGLLLLLAHGAGLLPWPLGTGFLGDVVFAASASALAFGYGASYGLALRVIRLGGRRDLLAALWLMPAYWLLISAAAFAALAELLVHPHRWSKTPHDPHEDG